MSACAPSCAMHNGLCPELMRATTAEIWAFEIYAKYLSVVGSGALKSLNEAHLNVFAVEWIIKYLI
jgi:hypothetical protein